MAGDWIKMRTDLHTDPRVVRISCACKAHRCAIVGALHFIWSLFDSHSADGELVGYTPELVDEMAGIPGVCQAMREVGWMTISPNCLSVPDFDKHNGASAKRRAQNASRVRISRECASRAQNVRAESAPEKRREEKKKAAEAEAALLPAAAGVSAGVEEEARTALIEFHIGEPSLSELAQSGLNGAEVRSICRRIRSAGKGQGVMVNELRTAAQARKANAGATMAARATRDAWTTLWGSMNHETREKAREAYRTAKPHMRQYTGGAIEDLPGFQVWLCERSRGEVAA